MCEEIKYNEIEDLDYCLELLNKRDKEIESLYNIINQMENELVLNLPFKVVGVRHLLNLLKKLKGV